MKNLLSGIVCTIISLHAFSQNHIKGKVVDALSGIPVPNASVEIENAGTTLTNDAGVFEFKKINAKNNEHKITSIG
ncbi:MAG: carboxypeptidase-like regulatory domain-containing protein, partial [Bacteroidota bacterium]